MRWPGWSRLVCGVACIALVVAHGVAAATPGDDGDIEGYAAAVLEREFRLAAPSTRVQNGVVTVSASDVAGVDRDRIIAALGRIRGVRPAMAALLGVVPALPRRQAAERRRRGQLRRDHRVLSRPAGWRVVGGRAPGGGGRRWIWSTRTTSWRGDSASAIRTSRRSSGCSTSRATSVTNFCCAAASRIASISATRAWTARSRGSPATSGACMAAPAISSIVSRRACGRGRCSGAPSSAARGRDPTPDGAPSRPSTSRIARRTTGTPTSPLRAGIQLDGILVTRNLQILLEYFRGHSPNGQFYREKVDYLGLGVHFYF